MPRKGEIAVGAEASKLINQRIIELADWRGELLSQLRGLILDADPEIIEEWKWGIPVWNRSGIICTGETYQKAVKLTFAKGAAVKDPAKLFNSSLEGNVRRAIDFPEGAKVNVRAFQALVRAAVELNESKAKKKPAPVKKKPAVKKPAAAKGKRK